MDSVELMTQNVTTDVYGGCLELSVDGVNTVRTDGSSLLSFFATWTLLCRRIIYSDIEDLSLPLPGEALTQM